VTGEHTAAGAGTTRMSGDVTILIAEDEADIRELVRYNFEQEGYAVQETGDGKAALDMARRSPPDLLVLDLMLPGMDGIAVCRALRSDRQTARLPIVMLTARTSEADRILGLEMGADDYVTKPFSPRELVARVRALLRRARPAPSGTPYRKGHVHVDFERYEARADGRLLDLSRREFELLKFFLRNPNRVFDRLTILDLVWGDDTYVEPRTVDVHVRRLRRQLERDDAHPELIVTVRGVGYKFDERALET